MDDTFGIVVTAPDCNDESNVAIPVDAKFVFGLICGDGLVSDDDDGDTCG